MGVVWVAQHPTFSFSSLEAFLRFELRNVSMGLKVKPA
jgi:hypothetical protein